MAKDIIQLKLYGFRLSSDDDVPCVVAALSLADALDIWLVSHDCQDPFDVHFIGTAYGFTIIPF